jgi:hypothetical protein
MKTIRRILMLAALIFSGALHAARAAAITTTRPAVPRRER